MLVAAALAFGFTFSLVPLYRIACEKVLGIRVDNTAATASAAAVDEDRWVTVEFDGGVNSKLPWQFRPTEASMRVRPGEQYKTMYYAHTDSDRTIVGSAVPSLAPARASRYFSKTECFCFTAQTLPAGAGRDMPVRLIADPALPATVRALTLSYTFSENDALTGQQQLPAE